MSRFDQLIKQKRIFNYDINKFKFREKLCKIFDDWNKPVEELYKFFENSDKIEQITIDKDTTTMFHRKYYDSLYYQELLDTYYNFIREVVLPLFDEEELVVQKDPSFRIHLPNNTAIGYRPNMNDPVDMIGLHCDGDYGHPEGEINFMLTFSGQYGNNTCFVETFPESNIFEPIEMKYGEFASFNGNKCRHFNKRNDTGICRVSIDFRVIPKSKYNCNYKEISLHGKRKFLIGDYYIVMRK